MARTSALGRFLKDTKGKGKQRQTSVSQGQKEALERQLVIWKLRGALWGISIVIVMTAYGISTLTHSCCDTRRNLLIGFA